MKNEQNNKRDKCSRHYYYDHICTNSNDTIRTNAFRLFHNMWENNDMHVHTWAGKFNP